MADGPPTGNELDGDAELQELRALARRLGLGAGQPPERLQAPPEDLWDRVAAEVGEPVAAPLASRTARRRRWYVPVGAAAAALVVLIVVFALGGDDSEVLATADLEPLGPAGAGSAELIEVDGGHRLRVDTSGLDPGEDFLEVWVIDQQVERLVSLGPLRDDGLYDLPAGLDPQAFPIVDVSLEPIDGDPTHSGDSVLRGELEF